MMSWILIIVAVTVASIEWLTAVPKPGEALWPRWTKLLCSLVVAGVGVAGVFEGYFDRQAGIVAFKQRELLSAVEKLNSAYASPFKNRQVLDYLGLAHKGIADQAVDGPVAKVSYEKALQFLVESRVKYPNSPYAKNAMVNIYRRMKNWVDLHPLASSFESELQAGSLKRDGASLSKKQRATFLVTLANVFADQDNPHRSDEHAVTLYGLAQSHDPENMFVILNMPPRLIDIAKRMPSASARRHKLLEKALSLSVAGMKLDEPRDQVFSVLSIIQIVMMEDAPSAADYGYDLKRALAAVRDNQEARADFEVDTWFILTEAYTKSDQLKRAREAFNQALIYQARFTDEQRAWGNRLWKTVVDEDELPFQRLLGAKE